MLHALLVLATSAASEDETSKTAFYLCGGLLAAWAVVVTVIGMTSATFPASTVAKRGVMAVTAVLMAGAMATAVITG
jgi:hypothetical protein